MWKYFRGILIVLKVKELKIHLFLMKYGSYFNDFTFHLVFIAGLLFK